MTKAGVFKLLNHWRELGLFNMYEAPTHLSELFGWKKQEARDIFIEWTRAFNVEGDYEKYESEELKKGRR